MEKDSQGYTTGWGLVQTWEANPSARQAWQVLDMGEAGFACPVGGMWALGLWDLPFRTWWVPGTKDVDFGAWWPLCDPAKSPCLAGPHFPCELQVNKTSGGWLLGMNSLAARLLEST